ncbi:response regulator [Hansschlegelia sp. KR7-227]|jgi:DNA-binding response OmpR family regulator|uniref:response regulator n=1 Tax=Hansschlegelia sp. KR7-227 TaxID=3400914 RepID=UPI003C000E25
MRVLLVEDDMVIAGGLAPAISEAGFHLLGLAADQETAVALLRSTDVHIAVVDLRLADGWTGADVARAAVEEGVAVVFVTATPDRVPKDLGAAYGVIEKPCAPEAVAAALRFVAMRLRGVAAGEAPAGLTLSPDWTSARPWTARRPAASRARV